MTNLLLVLPVQVLMIDCVAARADEHFVLISRIEGLSPPLMHALLHHQIHIYLPRLASVIVMF